MYLALTGKKNLKLNGNFWEDKNAKMILQLMQQPTFLLEPTAENIRYVINESPIFSKRSLVVRKCCVYAVKPIVVMTPIPTNTYSAAKVQTKER